MSKLKGAALLLYEKLKEEIKNMVPGDCLPSIQELKSTHNVGQGTIEKALWQLEKQNLIVIKRKKGCFVLDNEKQPDDRGNKHTGSYCEHFPWLNIGNFNIRLELAASAFPNKMLEHLVAAYNKQAEKNNIILVPVDDREFSFSQRTGFFDLRYFQVHLQIMESDGLFDLTQLMNYKPLCSDLHPMSFFKDAKSSCCKALALFMSMAFLAYDKTIFDKLKLNVDILSSWDGFVGACATIKQKFPQKFPFICSGYMSSLPRWGFSLKDNNLEFKTKEFIAYLNFLKKMVHDEQYMPDYGKSWKSYLPQAQDQLDDYVMFEYYPHLRLNHKNLKLWPMPLRPTGHELISSALLGIGKNSEFTEAAWDFIRFALSLEGQKIINHYKHDTRPSIKDCKELIPDDKMLSIMEKVLASGELAYINSSALFDSRLIIESRIEAWLKNPDSPEKLSEEIQSRVAKFVLNMKNCEKQRI